MAFRGVRAFSFGGKRPKLPSSKAPLAASAAAPLVFGDDDDDDTDECAAAKAPVNTGRNPTRKRSLMETAAFQDDKQLPAAVGAQAAAQVPASCSGTLHMTSDGNVYGLKEKAGGSGAGGDTGGKEFRTSDGCIYKLKSTTPLEATADVVKVTPDGCMYKLKNAKAASTQNSRIVPSSAPASAMTGDAAHHAATATHTDTDTIKVTPDGVVYKLKPKAPSATPPTPLAIAAAPHCVPNEDAATRGQGLGGGDTDRSEMALREVLLRRFARKDRPLETGAGGGGGGRGRGGVTHTGGGVVLTANSDGERRREQI